EERRDYIEDEIMRFIYEPGFSTQEINNNISGRGVGLNVVQEEIRRMGGKVEILNHPGAGCIFTLRIPMNLAVVNGTIVDLPFGRYILPTLFIKEFFVAEADNWVTIQGRREAIRVRDLVIPILWAEKLFGSEDYPDQAQKMQVVILEMDQKLLAFPVSKIVSRQEIVSKPLIRELSNLGYASGLSILGDGTVSLILDVETMFRLAEVRANRTRVTH
ncbi:MAG: chemotaxis protein CheW, partial [Methylocystaceae bacterium]